MGKKILERLGNGIIKENPILVGMLGICSTLAVTTSAINGLGMGASTLIVLALSNLIISLLRNFLPNSVRIPGYIVIVASLVTIIQFFMQGFVPDLYESLGIFIPLIVVNCIILGRAESYAAKNGPILSLFDGIGVGLGFTMTLTILGAIREFLGSGTVFSTGATQLFKLPEGTWYEPASIFVLAPGAFFVLAFMTAVMNRAKRKKGLPQAEVPDYTQDGGCASCSIDSCAGKTIAEMNNKNKVEIKSRPIDVVVKEKTGEGETKE
ncbi:MAG: electron transport complex subunit E [Lachnospiraceae bacterium]|nr:electron transport complex subunit E [Lachnospiraceae bacterium]